MARIHSYPLSMATYIYNISIKKIRNEFKNYSCFTLSKYLYSKFFVHMRNQSSKVFKTCLEQYDFIGAHRIRRNYQILLLYKYWWGSFKMNAYFQTLTVNLIKNKKYLFTVCFTPVFQWDIYKIPDNEILKLENEFENTKNLLNNQENNNCFSKDKINIEDNCKCDRCNNVTGDDWTLFFSNETFKIWRKEHVNYKGQGLYVYKVYGYFNDVTATDFFQVQIDCEYRKKWDENSVQLHIMDSDSESNSDILYWEFLFPKMFYNRDYVCNRRYKIDENKKYMIIVSQSVIHPLCPEKPPVHRVTEYWSHMVIKPCTTFDEPGVEFTVTYFDNPGLNVPSYVSNWYAITGMPEYLLKQKEAALNLAKNNFKNFETKSCINHEHTELKIKKEENMSKADPNSLSQQSSDKHIILL